MRPILFLPQAISVLLALSGVAQATPHVSIIFDSIGQTNSSNVSINSAGPLAASFETPAYAGSISSLILDLDCSSCSTSKGAFKIELFSNSGASVPGTAPVTADVPNAVLATDIIPDDSVADGLGLFTVENPFGNVTLTRASYSRILPSPWKDSTHPLIAVRDVAM